MKDRPALKMDIIGRAVPQADSQGWLDDQMCALKATYMAVHGKAIKPMTICVTRLRRARRWKREGAAVI